MVKLALSILILFLAVGSVCSSDDFGANYGYYNSFNNTYSVPVYYSQSVSNLDFASNTNYYDSSKSLYPIQTSMDAYRNTNALGNTINQAIPENNYTKQNLPSQPLFAPIDYSQMNVYMLEKQAEIQDYSRQLMQKNEEMIQNSRLDYQAPVYVLE